MVDHHPSENERELIAPRCGEHGDFGSLAVIQATHPGLQVFLDNKWQELPPIPRGSSTLPIFG
jgi:isopenicillin N synthase-like dioxygenase